MVGREVVLSRGLSVFVVVRDDGKIGLGLSGPDVGPHDWALVMSRTIFPVPQSVVVDLARLGVRRIGPRYGFGSRSAAFAAIRKLRGRP